MQFQKLKAELSVGKRLTDDLLRLDSVQVFQKMMLSIRIGFTCLMDVIVSFSVHAKATPIPTPT